jgi:hypothetical protein
MKLRGYLFAAATAATAVAGLTGAAQAATFGNSGISFDTDTTVNFTFKESNGRFRSDLGVQEANVPGTFKTLFSEEAPGYDTPRAGDWTGSCGVTVLNCNTSFKFEAGKTYTFVLTRNSGTNGVRANRVFSTNSLNSNNYKQANFTGDLFAGGATIAFEDIGGNPNASVCNDKGSNPKADCDFNDFMFTAEAEATESVPEPATLAGLGAVAAGFVVSRRRRKTA